MHDMVMLMLLLRLNRLMPLAKSIFSDLLNLSLTLKFNALRFKFKIKAENMDHVCHSAVYEREMFFFRIR